MAGKLKIKVNFDGETTKALLNFITETQEGKYTKEKPELTQITYRRLDVQEQDKSLAMDSNGDCILYGITY